MWSAAEGASSYSVQAVTDQGLMVTCNTSNTSCFLDGFQCSEIYNVTVTAQNQACDSGISETSRLMTGLLQNQEQSLHSSLTFPLFFYSHVCFPPFRALPSHKCSSHFEMWRALCDRVLAAERTCRGVCRLFGKRKSPVHFLCWHRHKLWGLRPSVRHSV